VEFLIEREKAVPVDDLLIRRSKLAWLGELTKSLVEGMAEIMGKSLGWNLEQEKAVVERTLNILKDMHGVNL
jgi:glycerol-3-phosphate dehydrogenase